MRWMTTRLLCAVLLSANLVFLSCDDDDDDDIIFVDDVLVEITGDAGVPFDGFVEDDRGARSLSGTVPLTEEYFDQEGFFHVELDKTENGSAELCVTVTSTDRTRESCTIEPFGSASVTIVF